MIEGIWVLEVREDDEEDLVGQGEQHERQETDQTA
jgi:hypothetical protein